MVKQDPMTIMDQVPEEWTKRPRMITVKLSQILEAADKVEKAGGDRSKFVVAIPPSGSGDVLFMLSQEEEL